MYKTQSLENGSDETDIRAAPIYLPIAASENGPNTFLFYEPMCM